MDTRRKARTNSISPEARDDGDSAASHTVKEPDDENQSDEEPSASVEWSAGSEVKKVGSRVDTKNIKIRMFDGALAPSVYDTGARKWWDVFAD